MYIFYCIGMCQMYSRVAMLRCMVDTVLFHGNIRNYIQYIHAVLYMYVFCTAQMFDNIAKLKFVEGLQYIRTYLLMYVCTPTLYPVLCVMHTYSTYSIILMIFILYCYPYMLFHCVCVCIFICTQHALGYSTLYVC